MHASVCLKQTAQHRCLIQAHSLRWIAPDLSDAERQITNNDIFHFQSMIRVIYVFISKGLDKYLLKQAYR